MSDELLGPDETDEQRDARFKNLNDQIWGMGEWIRCPVCPLDGTGRQPYHSIHNHDRDPTPDKDDE